MVVANHVVRWMRLALSPLTNLALQRLMHCLPRLGGLGSIVAAFESGK